MKTIISILCLSFLMLVGASAQSQKMKPNMEISISIAGVPSDDMAKISSEYRLDEKAHLRLPYLDGFVIETKGLTSAQLAAKISKAYKENKIFASAVMTVKTHDNAVAREWEEKRRRDEYEKKKQEEERKRLESRVVYVSGEAKSPGEFKYTDGMTVGQLLAKCGGAGVFAKKDRFILIRNEQSTTYNFKKDPKVKFYKLRPGDEIEFVKSRF